PFARAADTLATRILKFPFRPSAPRLVGENLSTETLSTCLSELPGKRWLRPDYDSGSLDWILQRSGQLQRNGSFQKILVRTEKDIAGWYLYYLNSTGVSQVIQLHAR